MALWTAIRASAQVPPPPAPCDIQVKIVEQGRTQAEQAWAALAVENDKLKKELAAAQAKKPEEKEKK